MGAFGQGKRPTKPGDPVAAVNGQPISEQELIETLGPQWLQLRTQEYELKSKGLDGLVLQRLIEAELANSADEHKVMSWKRRPDL
jgi:hypothetical protein